MNTRIFSLLCIMAISLGLGACDQRQNDLTNTDREENAATDTMENANGMGTENDPMQPTGPATNGTTDEAGNEGDNTEGRTNEMGNEPAQAENPSDTN